MLSTKPFKQDGKTCIKTKIIKECEDKNNHKDRYKGAIIGTCKRLLTSSIAKKIPKLRAKLLYEEK